MADLRSLPTTDGRREGASPLRQELRRETADLHRRLEIDLGLLESELSLDRYRRVLEFFFGFYAPVEAGLARVASAGPPLGFPLRARTALIESDLLSLGLSRRELADLPRCADLPRLSCPEDLAGCLYVLEGACLGGQVIAPALRERLGVAKGSGASFFIGDAEGTSARWRLFLAWLEGLARAGAANRRDRRLGARDFSGFRAMGGAAGSFAASVRRGDAMVDLTDCDREPIHIPGTIQPYGVLFVLAEPALTVTQVSENVGDHLPLRVEDILGRPLSTMIDPASVAEVREALGEERWQEMNPLHISAHGRQFDGIVHRHEGAAILELEPNPNSESTHRDAPPVPAGAAADSTRGTSAELADVVVQQIRRVTGFERVMFYRFHEDGHGSVDAEAKEPALEPYLGLHYPASDIPAQARELYRKNWLRLIFDASAKPARVVPTLRVDTGGPLDLSFSVLRSVSPIHLEYMANMGVRASMSISLIVRDRLWGLISCLNHTSPRRVSHETRMAL